MLNCVFLFVFGALEDVTVTRCTDSLVFPEILRHDVGEIIS